MNGVKAEIEEKKSETEILQKRVQELSESRSIVIDMAKELKELKKGTALWEKAEKMGFMGLGPEKEDRSEDLRHTPGCLQKPAIFRQKWFWKTIRPHQSTGTLCEL